MNKQTRIIISVVFVLIAAIILIKLFFPNKNNYSYLIDEGITGQWGGLLETPSRKYYIYTDISVDKANDISISLSSPRQKAFSIKVDSLIIHNHNIKFSVKKVSAKFVGKFIPDSSKIIGKWIQEKHTSQLIFYHKDEMGRIKRPQYPFKPYPYFADSVSFVNAEDSISLTGTFTYPKKKNEKTPAILLLSGIGPQNRDGTVYGHSPLLVIADYFTRKGFSVLRYDDRGTGQSEGNYFGSTTEDFTKDALSAIKFLKSQNNIDTNKIGIIGFNEGGIIGAKIAAKYNSLKFLVLLSTPGVSAEKVLLTQTKVLQKNAGVPKKEIKFDYNINKKIFQIITSVKDSIKARQQLKTLYNNLTKKLSKNEAQMRKYALKVFEKKMDFMLKPWFRNFLRINVKSIYKHVNCPVLVLYGSKDLQIEPKINMDSILKSLKNAGNSNVKGEIIPKLNHFFQNSKTGLPNEYFKINETFSEKVLNLINKWVKNNISENT